MRQDVAPSILRLRRTCWRVLFSLDALIAPICRLLAQVRREAIDAGGGLSELEELVQAAENLRRVRHPFYRRTLEVARERVSAALAEFDLDESLLDCVVAEMISDQAGLHAGDVCSALASMEPPLRIAYASAVQATYQALWISRQCGVHSDPSDVVRTLP